jgi:hypothetical protein
LSPFLPLQSKKVFHNLYFALKPLWFFALRPFSHSFHFTPNPPKLQRVLRVVLVVFFGWFFRVFLGHLFGLKLIL